MAPHSSTLAWKIPWTEEPGGLQSMGSLGVGRLSDFTFTFHFPASEKEMATHSSVLAWRIPGTGEPRGLPSMGSRRVRHNWSDLAAAAASLVHGLSNLLFLIHLHLLHLSFVYFLVLKKHFFSFIPFFKTTCILSRKHSRLILFDRIHSRDSIKRYLEFVVM